MIIGTVLLIAPAFVLWFLRKTPLAKSPIIKVALVGGYAIYVMIIMLFMAVFGAGVIFSAQSASSSPSTTYNTSDCFLRYPYASRVSQTQGPHGADYGHWAIDLVGGAGTVVLSPIDGEVVNTTMDVYGNPTLEIENDCHKVTLLHGEWNDFSIGEIVYAGQEVGTESNQGYTFTTGNRYCGTGSGCGYHLHINVFDRQAGGSIDPSELWVMEDRVETAVYALSPSFEPANTQLKISIYDPELGGINCAEPCGMMASGELVADWWGKAAACPMDVPFWTVIQIEGVGEFTCLDRGGAIVRGDGFMWVDLLLHQNDFGTVPAFGTLLPPQMWAIDYK